MRSEDLKEKSYSEHVETDMCLHSILIVFNLV